MAARSKTHCRTVLPFLRHYVDEPRRLPISESMRFVGSPSEDAFGKYRQGGDRRAAAQQPGFRGSDRSRNRIISSDQFKRIAAGDGTDLSGIKNAGIHYVEEVFLDHFPRVPHDPSLSVR
nr:hypothetical protein [Ensifer aridi]